MRKELHTVPYGMFAHRLLPWSLSSYDEDICVLNIAQSKEFFFMCDNNARFSPDGLQYMNCKY